ncbi:MAG: hypothetical protein IJJ67_04110 [Oscillospiraceae bacterium]|nr:hypothetical protein [Oscillospiraceae bacterium]
MTRQVIHRNFIITALLILMVLLCVLIALSNGTAETDNADVQEANSSGSDAGIQEESSPEDFADLTENHITPEMFGAAGDGFADDTAAWQQALMLAQKNGVAVFGSPGKTYLCKDLYICSYAIIDLNGATLNIGGISLFLPDTKATGYDGEHDIEIRNGTIQRVNSIAICHNRNVVLKDLAFVECKGNHFIEICASRDILIENCSFSGQQANNNTYGEMVQLDVLEPSSFHHFSDNTLNNATYDGTPLDNIVIRGCTFNRGQSHMHGGVGSHIDNMLSGNGSMHTNITVEDCVFTGSENNSITAEGVNGFFVRNNYFCDNEGDCIQLKHSNENIEICGNTFENCSAGTEGEPHYIINTSKKDVYAQNGLLLSGNVILSREERGTAFLLYFCSPLTVSDNDMEGGFSLLKLEYCKDITINSNICHTAHNHNTYIISATNSNLIELDEYTRVDGNSEAQANIAVITLTTDISLFSDGLIQINYGDNTFETVELRAKNQTFSIGEKYSVMSSLGNMYEVNFTYKSTIVLTRDDETSIGNIRCVLMKNV